MNHELAKQLKDAGWVFKQNARGETIDIDGVMHTLPTLEELIEACGGKNLNLVADRDGRWSVRNYLYAISVDCCSTPTEAVVRLYLALHPHVAP